MYSDRDDERTKALPIRALRAGSTTKGQGSLTNSATESLVSGGGASERSGRSVLTSDAGRLVSGGMTKARRELWKGLVD